MNETNLERSVLIVTYHFPPYGSVASLRAAYIAQLLAERGWTVHVLHAAPSRNDPRHEGWAEQLEAKGIERYSVVPSSKRLFSLGQRSLSTIRLRHWLRYPFLSAPDFYADWIDHALEGAERFFSGKPINIVLGIAPPLSSAQAADAIARRLDIPLAVDIGELLELVPYRAPSYNGRSPQQVIDLLLRRAAYTTVISRHQKEQILRRTDFLSHEDIGILPHQLCGEVPVTWQEGTHKQYTIVVAAEELHAAILRPLLKILRMHSWLSAVVIGDVAPSIRSAIGQWQLTDRVQIKQKISAEELDAAIAQSGAVVALATTWCSTPTSVVHRAVYAGKPVIIAGEYATTIAADLPQESVAVLPSVSPAALDAALTQLRNGKKPTRIVSDDREVFEREFSRRLGMVMKL
ncbi:MAG: hypothetical protein RML15_04970 [Bacteroidota bacterium]|nr:hypothetical protein [Candidatus Kapabacteria bacterium]MCS7303267.1 hypothetical protein [Candidatus Kapabacteria bacterium]MCX7937315.1 hypothetical protein [Chlorobiota bacterium]MDW8271744.1 hypothetical protein [Bacteroidota bacterium]